MRPPTGKQSSKYKAVIALGTSKRIFCPSFFLQGACKRPGQCKLDHSREGIDEDVLYALRYAEKSELCGRSGRCRVEDCLRSHLCTKLACDGTGRGKKKQKCRIPRAGHEVDCKFDRWVPAGATAAASTSGLTSTSANTFGASAVATKNDDEMEDVDDTERRESPGISSDAGSDSSEAWVRDELGKLID